MKEGFRQAMAWLHTWAGLIFGWLLFAIFLTGTLAYFKGEITHWMQPEVPAHAVDDARSVAVAQSYLQARARLGFPMATPELRDEVLAKLEAAQ